LGGKEEEAWKKICRLLGRREDYIWEQRRNGAPATHTGEKKGLFQKKREDGGETRAWSTLGKKTIDETRGGGRPEIKRGKKGSVVRK